MRLWVIDETSDTVTRYWEGHNISCTAGLAVLSPRIVDPLGTAVPVTGGAGTYGAIGGKSGNPPATPTPVVPSASDTILAHELKRNYVTTYGSSGTSFTLTFTFGYPPATTQYKINEAGIFITGTTSSGSGSMLDHAAISPVVTQTSTEVSVLSVTFTLS